MLHEGGGKGFHSGALRPFPGIPADNHLEALRRISTRNRPELPPEIAFLNRFGIGYPALYAAAHRARRDGADAAQILILDGVISETDYFRCMAEYLGLPFDGDDVDPAVVVGHGSAAGHSLDRARLTMVRDRGPFPVARVSPDGKSIRLLQSFLARHPGLRDRTVITTNSVNRRTLVAGNRFAFLNRAVDDLKQRLPAFSASTIITAGQIASIALIFAALAFATYLWPLALLIGLHVAASIFYLICVLVRLAAALTMPGKTPDELPPMSRPATAELPVYTVLVALYNEANQIDDLVAALSRLDWPRAKLEIKLICEGDDPATIEAVKRAIPGPPFELVIVPPALPRTKPKALNFALPLCKGRFLVLYDAEDRPHPRQLMEAYQRFSTSDDGLACLQAPLVIHNARQGLLTELFAIEYSALFSGLLPTLARWRCPVPLGGTSNHFRRAALEHVGAWDPYNLTEDADLGIRLARMGFSTGVLQHPTYEEAPRSFDPWIRQRSRWFKGWLQTWLVHMRHPIELVRGLGWLNGFMFHAIITGIIVSALSHPFFLISLAATIYLILASHTASTFQTGLAVLDLSNILLGYLSFGILAWKTLPLSGLTWLRGRLFAIPAYWLLISIGAWRAVWHLIFHPFVWEKTPHVMTSQDGTEPS